MSATYGDYTVSYEPDAEWEDAPWMLRVEGEWLERYATEAEAVRYATEAVAYDRESERRDALADRLVQAMR